MKILLIANYLPDGQQSMLHFANMLYKGLIELKHDVRLIRPKPFFNFFKQSYKGLGKWLGYLDKFIIFPIRLVKAKHWADIVHICDHSNAIYTRYLKDIPYIVTCCDMLAIRSAQGEFKENSTRWTGRQLQKMILNGLNKAQYVVCISKATRDDLLRISNLKPEKTSIIYMGLNYPYSPMQYEKASGRLKSLKKNIKYPFILHVGKSSWYKNRLGVLNIFRHMLRSNEISNLNLIFAGQKLTKEMHRYIKQYHLEQKVIGIISPKDEDLDALYSLAEALIYPSLQEGFGWPIIEAQACGCPVFTTNRAPMTEAGGDAAIYFDPYKPEETAYIIVKNLKYKDRIKEKGFLNIKRFNTEKMMEEYIKVYQKILCEF